jgi:hypothetical protein
MAAAIGTQVACSIDIATAGVSLCICGCCQLKHRPIKADDFAKR